MSTLKPKFSNWLVIILGSLLWSITMIKSGWIYKYGMGFWGPNGHDGIWHLSLANSLAQGSFRMPIFAGETIKNYHVGFDLLLAFLHVTTRIPIVNIYFQVLPILVAIGIGATIYFFVKEIYKSELAAFWALVFTYIGTSWGWIISVIRYGEIGGESMFWAQQATSTLLNPPFALSLVLMLLGLTLLLHGKKLFPIIIFSLLLQVKIYAAILLFGALFVAGVYQYFLNKKSVYLQVWFFGLVLGALMFFPLNRSSSGLIVFQPFWFLETMMAISDRLNWPKFYEAMINYRAAHNYVKAPLAYLVAFGIFVLGNLGLRIVGLGEIFRWIKSDRKPIFLLILAMIIGGFVLPMVILQEGTPWNTIQFTYYSLVLMGIVTGVYVSRLKYQKLLLAVFLLISAPAIYGMLVQYLPNRPPAMISRQELDAMAFLAKQSPGIVLTPVYDAAAAKAAEGNPPRPLYLYESTAYVAAFTGQPVYLEDEVNLNITNYPWQERRQAASKFFTTSDETQAKEFLQKNHIKYLYLDDVSDVRPVLGEKILGMKNIYENSQVAIWATEP